MVKLKIKWRLFTHYPRCLDNIAFEHIYEELKDMCRRYDNLIKGKIYPSRRLSCVFSNLEDKFQGDAKSGLFSYTQLTNFNWTSAPIVHYIKIYLEIMLETYFDYCLAHIYEDGSDIINWHHDKEALYSDVVSVSFGANRKFRLRHIGETKSYKYEFLLRNGDIFHMLNGCQRELEHCIPIEKSVKEARINLTFRKAVKTQ